MTANTGLKKLSALAATSQLVWALDAHAYLDPGTGSFVFQAIVALLVGAAFTLKVYWQRLRDLFTRGTSRAAESRPDDGKGGVGRP